MSTAVWLIFTFTLIQMSLPVSSALIDENCGKVKEHLNVVKNITTKIAGGEMSKMLANPWMVELSRDGKFVCGGTLINSREYYPTYPWMPSLKP